MGYEIEYFVKEVDEHIICSICNKVFKDPMNCTDGHTFCKACIGQWLQNDNKCPEDGEVIENQALSPNIALRGILDNLNVVCHKPDDSTTTAMNGDVGVTSVHNTCNWTGKLETLDKHRKTCPYQQVPCPNGNCNTNMQIKDLEEHDKVCRYIKVECEKCSLDLIRHLLESHKEDDCQETQIVCPNKCTNTQGLPVKFKRSETETHLMNECAKTIVDCSYKELGCLKQVERQDVDKHQEDMAAHMMLLAKQCLSLAKENKLLKQELKKVKRNMRELEVEVINKSRYVWKIYDYHSQHRKYNNGSWIRSPTFWLCGYSWYLKLYPNGFKECQDFVSLYLVLSNEGCTAVNRGSWNGASKSGLVPSRDVSVFSVSITVKSQDQGAAVTHNLELKLDNGTNNSTGTIRGGTEVAGIKELMKVTDSLSPSYCNVKDGYLTITCILC